MKVFGDELEGFAEMGGFVFANHGVSAWPSQHARASGSYVCFAILYLLNSESHAAIINETVLVAKAFLDEELAKYDSWEKFLADKNISRIIEIDKEHFSRLKKDGVGRDTIQKFLGKNWERERKTQATLTK